jgi:inhibitor of cysteine peptidase
MKNFKIASLLMFAVFALSMISGASAAHVNGTQVVPVHKTVNTHVNNKFTITVTGNPSTGYGWVPQYDHKYLKLVSSKFTPSSKLIGAPGVQKYVFKAIKKGNTKIDLKYLRSWDKKHPAKEIVYFVNIKK